MGFYLFSFCSFLFLCCFIAHIKLLCNHAEVKCGLQVGRILSGKPEVGVIDDRSEGAYDVKSLSRILLYYFN